MSDVSGIPNLGIPGLSGFNNQQSFINPSSGLQNAQDQYSRNQQYFGNQAATQQAAQVPQNQLYGPLGFGGQTAQSAAIGAAYGRGTGGFNAGGGSSVFDTGAPPVPYLDSPPPGSFSPTPAPPSGRGLSSVFDTGAPPVPYQNSPPMGSFSPSPNYPGGSSFVGGGRDFNQTFGDVGFTPQMQNQPAINAVNQFSGRGTGVPAFNVPPSQPPSQAELGGGGGRGRDLITQTLVNGGPQGTGGPMPGMTPDFQGPSDENSFASRFAPFMQGNPGTPSQYTSSPYTDVGGTTHQPNIPPGYQTLFSADNPGGALPVGGFRGLSSPPIMNESWDPGESADTLTPGDRSAPHSFYGSAFDPAQFQPSGTGSSGGGGIGSDMLRGGQNQPYAQPWHSLIPSGTPNTPEVINQINYTAGRGRYDPEALANVINTESQFNPQTNTGSFFGATQMGPKSFREAGGTLGGMNFGQYQQAPLEQQIPAYGDWLQHYAQPGNAAGLATSGLRDLPVPMQSAILQGTQFGPNSTGWPAGLAEGNMNMNVSPIQKRTGLPAPQATFLGPGGNSPYPTIESMNSYFGRGR